MRREAPGILSIDVFDTTLTRSCGPPQAAYLWLGRRLHRAGAIQHTPEAFARARIQAERDVWRRAGGMDAHVFLEDFYREVARALWLDADTAGMLVDEELRVEEEVLRPVPAAVRLIEEAQRRGRDIVFVSDTYFPQAFVERLLKGAGLFTDGARCFASSELAASKASGKLFDTVIAETGARPEAILHAGDNAHSDVDVPRRKGLRARSLPDATLNRHERLLAEHMWSTSGTAAALAGASRQARLLTPARTAHERAIRDVGAGVAAPLLIGYVLWLLHRAQDLELERLVFLSRDGQVLAEIARRLAARLGLSTTISYLHVSRLSTNLAATFEADEEELGWVLRDRHFLSPEGMLRRLDIAWTEVAADLERRGVSAGTAPTSPATVQAMGAALRSEPLRTLVCERAAARRSLVRGYLEQEGLLDGGRFGIVDFGGVGSQMRALHALVTDAGKPAPRLFLVGVDRPEDAGLPAPSEEPAWLRDTECYLYDHRRELGIKRFRGFGTLVQMFCAADHDTVTGYRREGERVVPTLGGGSARLVQAWGLTTLRAAVTSVVEQVVLDEDLVDPRADLRAAACAVIAQFWAEPSVDEARAWGAFPFEGAQAEGSAPHPLAQGYTWPSAIAGVLRRTFPDLGWQHWHEASVRLSPPVLRSLLRTTEAWYWRLDTNAHPWARRAAGTVRRVLDR